MISFGYRYQVQGAAAAWPVGVIFTGVGIFIGLILPMIITPSLPKDAIHVQATVSSIDMSGDTYRPIFSYKIPGNEQVKTHRANVSSKPSAYVIGEQAMLAIDPSDETNVVLEHDKALGMALWVIRILGLVFGGIGIWIVISLLRGMGAEDVSRLGGLLGALSFGVPASFALPALLIAYAYRPNFLFQTEEAFGRQNWIIGSIFTVLGILTTIATLALNDYQKRTGKPGWSWSKHMEL